MTRYFMRDTPLYQMEQMMMTPPHFKPRGHGLRRPTFHYLHTKNAGAFLPEALSAMMTGTLDYYTGRMGSLLFKQGVDLHVLGQIIAYDTDIDEGEYQRLRGKAIRDMKRTNGRISFKDALDFQKSV